MCNLFYGSARAASFAYWSDILFFSISLKKRFQRRSRKMSQPIRGQGGHLVFQIGPKNTNLVEDVEILLPVKFRWIPFSGFREDVENVSAHERPGRPSCFSDRSKNTNLVEDVEILLLSSFVEFRLKRFQRRSRKCEKLTMDDGRRTTCDHNSALEHLAQVH